MSASLMTPMLVAGPRAILTARLGPAARSAEPPAKVPMWDYHGPMAELHVRNLPPELHQRLREQALAEGRSMSAEAVILLREALQPGGDQGSKRLAAVARLRQIRERSRLPAGAAPSEHLVREDRDTAR